MSKFSLAAEFEKEHIYVVEIDVPRCKLTHGSSPCTATETGDAKCYNTRTTCNDLANFDPLLTATGSISVSSTLSRFTASGINFLTIGFEVGQTITTSGFSNDGNNGQWLISAVTSTTITVTNNFGMVTESASANTITTPNLYTYRFCSARSPHPSGLNNVAPCVDSVSIAPAKVDAKGGIGARTSASIRFTDFTSSDRYGIDPYLSDRTYDPLDVGLFWTKWRARNENYENYDLRVLSGYIVDNTFDMANFETRYYVLSAMNASNGTANITAKDPLQLVSNKKALAPLPSTGTLLADLTDTATSFSLDPTGVGNSEYPSSGFVKIRDEVLSFTRSGDTMTVVRGQFNTSADSHESGDTVQLCLEYDGTRPMDEVQADLLINYASVPAIYIASGAWASEVNTFLTSNPNRLITDPTPVDKLIGQLCQQWPHKLFWNDRQRQIELVALKAPPQGSVNQLTGGSNLMELSVSDKPDMQLSTIFVMYGQFDPTQKVDEKSNYQVTYARVNQDAIARYNSNNTLTIYAPWILAGNGAAARRVATLMGRRFGFMPREANFALEDKDSNVWLGDIRSLVHHDISDRNGNSKPTTFEITQAAEGDTFTYQALEYNYDDELDGDDIIGNDVVDLNVDDRNINLRTLYEAIYGVPDGSTVAKFIVYAGVVIGSTSSASASIVTGSWPSGAVVCLQVNSGGVVVGHAGNGSSSAATSGGDGGDAISLGYDMEVINNGIIGGGGGGGGASAGGGYLAGGGGGAGDDGGSRGTNDSIGVGFPTNTTSPQNGSDTAGGNGGEVRYNNNGEPFILNGGNGGELGQNGGAGSGGTSSSAGGSAGKAVDLNGNTFTQTVGGDIRGAIS